MAGVNRLKLLFGYNSSAAKDFFKSNIIKPASGLSHAPVSQTGFFTKQSFNMKDSSLGGTYGTSSLSRSIGTYYFRLKELSAYETEDIVETVVGLYMDYITGYMLDPENLITVKEGPYKVYQDFLNKILSDLDIVKEIKDNLFELVYYESHSFAVRYDKLNKELIKGDLEHSNGVVSIYKEGEKRGNLLLNQIGTMTVVPPYSIFKISLGKYSLSSDSVLENREDNESDPLKILKSYKLEGSKPLFYGLLPKMKEFLLKDKLISLLTIKDLIQPLVMLVKVDKNTSPEVAAQLALNTENLINKYADNSSILSGNFDVQELITLVNDNVKVLPDYNSSVENMAPLDLTKLNDKVAQMRSEQDGNKEDILNTTAIPLDLFMGRASKYEALKSSERLAAKVNSQIKGINSSIINICNDLIYIFYNVRIPLTEISSNLFAKTSVDYNNAISNSETLTALNSSIINILKDADEFLSGGNLVDKKVYIKYLRDSIRNIDSELEYLITDETIQLYLADKSKEKDVHM